MTTAVNGYKYDRQTLLGFNVPKNLPPIPKELRKFKELTPSSHEPVSITAVKVTVSIRAHL